MTQEDKDLLFKDLCARLPYKVKVKIYNHWRDEYEYETLTLNDYGEFIDTFCVEDIKPILFPLSSMTEEQKKEFMEVSNCEMQLSEQYGYDSEGNYIIIIGEYEYNYDENITTDYFYPNFETFDWLNKNHFDYRGLIEKGLAIDATGLNIY